jgi:Na+/H+-dicarboxylate symporter
MRGRLIRALFIAICVGLAWCAWSSWSEAPPQYKNETLIKATIMLYALTLPSSCLLGLIHAGLILMIPMDRLDAGSAFLNWMFQTWAPLTVAGYLQWFVLVPRLVRRWRDRNTVSD